MAMSSAEVSIHNGTMSFAERLQRGAYNAAITCMGVHAGDRVFIITDTARAGIAHRIEQECLAVGAQVLVRQLEEYGARPLTFFPDALRHDLLEARPTVTFYVATAQRGEIALRIPLLPFLSEELKTRHGHMIGITEELMADGMCADYDEIYTFTRRMYERVKHAKRIHVTSAKGSDVTGTFHESWKWVPCDGRYHEQGHWGNLPEGEVFTAPASVDGVLVCDVLGDFFSEKYGVLETPLTVQIANGYVTEVSCDNTFIADDVRAYLLSSPNGNRAGEFAIGTLTSLTKLTGNLLQDEKMPGLHVAFGNPYPEATGADWDAKIHMDVIPTCCTIDIDGEIIMRDGKFTV